MDGSYDFPPAPLPPPSAQQRAPTAYAPYWAGNGQQQLPYSPQQSQQAHHFPSNPYQQAQQQQFQMQPPPQPLPPPLPPSFSQSHSPPKYDDVKPTPEERSRSPPEGPAPKRKRVIKPRPPAPEGVVITEKSCLRCRVRKVKCDRTFPACANCKTRNEDCDLISLHPKDKQSSTARDQADSERIARLEARLAELEGAVIPGAPNPTDPTKSFSSDSPTTPATSSSDTSTSPPVAGTSSALQVAAVDEADLGFGSVDARLSRPAMAKSLSQHLCDAFFTSCCWLLPSFSYYREKMPAYRDNVELPNSTKVAIAAFCAVGARASPHSAVLGIEAFPSDARDHPEAPLLSAGTRRQSACHVLVHQAHAQGFEHGLMDEPSMENLAALLALLQMIQFTDFLQPRKSRALLRAAIGHYRELQDGAATSEDSDEVQRIFGLAIFTTDSQNSAYARRSPLLSDADLSIYFSRAGIAVPTLPGEDLLSQLRTLLTHPSQRKINIKTALHLISCWTSTCQRLFAKLAAPPHRADGTLAQGALDLFRAVDSVRSSIHYVQSLVYSADSPSHSHGAVGHSHESDHLALVIRNDRDLIDLFAMTHVLLSSVAEKGGADESLKEVIKDAENRMRKALKVNALYAKLYTKGADAHMVFHTAMQLELTPNWTQLALQKVGEPGGPATKDEEVSETELGWLIEALQIACYYTPAAERRLAELSPRFVALDTAPIPSSPFPAAVTIGNSDPSPPASSASHTPPPGFSLESYSTSPHPQAFQVPHPPHHQHPQYPQQHQQPHQPVAHPHPILPHGYIPYSASAYGWNNATEHTSSGYATNWAAQGGNYQT